jgi:phosphoesterase RecJ-like protein
MSRAAIPEAARKAAAPEALLARLRGANRVLVTSHVSPDGDAVGSSIGLARILRRMGKSVVIWLHDPPPRAYSPLPGVDRIHVGPEPPAAFPESFDLAVVLECPSLDRCGLEKELAGLPLLNIDHHLGNQNYGQINWVDTASPAVGELVFRIAAGLHAEIDTDTANALYLALFTDTGGFRFGNSSPEAFEAAAALVRAGAEPATVACWLYESQPLAAIRLHGELTRTIELHHGGRVATARLTREMIAGAGAGPGDSEGLIDLPRSIAGVDAVAMFRELEGGGCKVSLRSRGAIDVEKVARRHGGGGHHNAAGFKSALPEAELLAETVAALGAAVAAAGTPSEAVPE